MTCSTQVHVESEISRLYRERRPDGHFRCKVLRDERIQSRPNRGGSPEEYQRSNQPPSRNTRRRTQRKETRTSRCVVAKLPRKIPGKDLLKVFQRLGFELVRQRGSHAFLRHPDGRRLTIPVYNAAPINLLNWILAEAKITRQEFLKLLK